ncbi:LMWPc domain-containing protein [Chloropicon primus]|uniref:protein-tyrosine-phosphatase n=1 Tax=Chloropicon primus TaxID=1764295 RepID=A0A5B8MTI8_9CHLO|nr:hypothetical protein A3770_11p61540 [Chloropicon primus]UPR02849.1 LMWPc domain-containing protein [Chloropicon primus]|eukprot:QDZ23636.1 hypothetical protein A3770_11p61540 [Chloropicon primus]
MALRPQRRRWSRRLRVLEREEDGTSREAVSRLTVSVSHRRGGSKGTEWSKDDDVLKVLFVSESGICRGFMAQRMFQSILADKGLEELVSVDARASRDYSLGDAPCEIAARAVGEEGTSQGHSYEVELLDVQADAAGSDLILVFDKFVAEDVMREITLFEVSEDSSDPSLSDRVYMLGEFGEGSTQSEKDIDDPLYGNYGGAQESEAVRRCSKRIRSCLEAVASKLESCAREGGGFLDPEKVRQALSGGMEAPDDLKRLLPPMLSKKK